MIRSREPATSSSRFAKDVPGGSGDIVAPSGAGARATLSPVFAGLRLGLHVLLIGLLVLPVVTSYVTGSPYFVAVLVVAVGFLAVYAGGAVFGHFRGTPASPVAHTAQSVAWVASLTLLWTILVWLSPEGAYLVFPLFFLYLHVLPSPGGLITVVVTTGIAVLALGLHLGFSFGGVIGPIVGAVVAVFIGYGYRMLTREVHEREDLVQELLATREQLAATEREQGAFEERARLARDIHDTVAQGLSSIQMLLHAAERTTPEPGLGHLRLARETAAESLADTRQIIRALTPESLSSGLADALRRLAAEQSRRTGILVVVEVDPAAEAGDLGMDTSTALLRIAQGALSNVVKHSGADRADISLSVSADGEVRLSIADNGVGFDPHIMRANDPSRDSFGLRAIEERVLQLGGALELEAVPGAGTTVTAVLPKRAGA